MAFIETPRFPTGVAYGFQGGPAYSTTIRVVQGGAEKRNVNWSFARARWRATLVGKSQADTDSLIAFFRNVKGSAHGFRFKDHADYDCPAAQGVLTLIAGSPSNEYQMYKRYTTGSFTEDRIIQKPVDGGATITGGGTYTVNYAAGIVIHTAGAAPTGWSGEFDVPVRFDSDELNIEIVERGETGFLYTWGDVQIVEIRP